MWKSPATFPVTTKQPGRPLKTMTRTTTCHLHASTPFCSHSSFLICLTYIRASISTRNAWSYDHSLLFIKRKAVKGEEKLEDKSWGSVCVMIEVMRHQEGPKFPKVMHFEKLQCSSLIIYVTVCYTALKLIDKLMNEQQGNKEKKGKGVKGKMIKTKWCGLKETLTNYGNKTIQE